MAVRYCGDLEVRLSRGFLGRVTAVVRSPEARHTVVMYMNRAGDLSTVYDHLARTAVQRSLHDYRFRKYIAGSPRRLEVRRVFQAACPMTSERDRSRRGRRRRARGGR